MQPELGENKSISADAIAILLKYPWPGNIRELQNIVERLVITTSSDVISEDDIFIFIKEAAEENTSPASDISLVRRSGQGEKDILQQALEATAPPGPSPGPADQPAHRRPKAAEIRACTVIGPVRPI